MSFLGKLTGGGVDWTVTFAEGAGTSGLLPGALMMGVARLTARREIEARAVVAALIGVAEWRVSTSRRNSAGQIETDTIWRRDDLGRVETVLAAGTRVANGQSLEFPFQFAVPLSAAPSFNSKVLRVKWEVSVKLDVGGVDPSANIPVRILLPASQLRSNAATLGLNALAPRVEGPDRGGHAIEVDPIPLVAGRPFRGTLETGESLKGARVEIKFETDVRDPGTQLIGAIARDTIGLTRETGDSDTGSVWVGELREAGDVGGGRRRYEFSGELPPATSPTILLPYGQSKARVDVVVSRQFLPDGHLTRDIAIATAEG